MEKEFRERAQNHFGFGFMKEKRYENEINAPRNF